MAIYRLHLTHITRSRGRSAQAHARYITRNDTRSVSPAPQRAPDRAFGAASHAAYLDRSGPSTRGGSRDDLVHAEHGNMPGWAQEQPQSFWRAADTFERANGRLYSEMEVAIPRELVPHDRLELVREFLQVAIGEYHPYSCAIHNAKALDGGEQPHAHIMFSTRVLDGIERDPPDFFARANTTQPELGGAAKDTTWYAKSTLQALRRDWADITNRTLERAGFAVRIDHRSLAARGIDRAPEPKMGTDQTAMLQRGDMTHTTAEVMQLRKDRAHAERLERAIDTTNRQLEDAKRVREHRHVGQRDDGRPTQPTLQPHRRLDGFGDDCLGWSQRGSPPRQRRALRSGHR